MYLYQEWMEPCAIMDRRTLADGLGGFRYEWTQGAVFNAAVVKNNTLEGKIAEKAGVTEIYTVYVDKGLSLEFHDVLRRLRDGAIFRITSNQNDSETPARASFQFGMATAEKWELTGTEVETND